MLSILVTHMFLSLKCIDECWIWDKWFNTQKYRKAITCVRESIQMGSQYLNHGQLSEHERGKLKEGIQLIETVYKDWGGK